MGMTFAEKVLAAKAGLSGVQPGRIVTIEPDVVLSHDNTAAIYDIFKRMGAKWVNNPDQLSLFADHAAPAPTTHTSHSIRDSSGNCRASISTLGAPDCHRLRLCQNHLPSRRRDLSLPR